MAKATRTLSGEELKGFVNTLNTVRSNKRNRAADLSKLATLRATRAAGGTGASAGSVSGGRGMGVGGGSSDGEENGFDGLVHAGGRALDILGSLGYSKNRVLSDAVNNIDRDRLEKDPVGVVLETLWNTEGLGRIPSAIEGFTDAITGDQEDLRHGFQIIEDVSDRAGGTGTTYKDVKDNVDPIVKGIGGFGIDVGNDPLTFSPAGPGLAAAKGGLRASVGAARATAGSDLAKTAAFFNPVTAAKGAGQGVREFVAGVRGRPVTPAPAANPAVEEALSGLTSGAARAATTPAAAAKKAPATAARGTSPTEIKLTEGVAEGARAAEATAQAASRPAATPAVDLIEEAAQAAPAPAPRPAGRPAQQPLGQAVEEAATKAVEKDVRTQMAEQLAPDIARAADASPHTDQILGNLRGLTFTASKYPTRLAREIESLTPLTDRKLVKEWTENAEALVGPDAAKELRKITDPEAFAARAKEIATERTVNTMDGKTPTDLFRKLTSGRNEFDPAKVREIAGLLGLKSVPAADANWKTFADYLRRVDPKAAYDELKRAQIAGRDLLAGTDLPGGAIAESMAKQIDPEGAKVAAAEAADDLIDPAVRAEYDTAIARIFPKDFEKQYRFTNYSAKTDQNFHTDAPKFGPGVSAVASHVFNQNHQLTLWKNLWEQAQGKFTGLKGAARQDAAYDYLMDGLRYTDLRLRSLGIVPVNGAMGAEKNLLKTKGDHAFLSFADVLTALPPETTKALLLSGKDINVPITMLSDTAREALRLAETDLDAVAQATTILHSLQQRLMKEFGQGGKKADVTKWLRDPKNTNVLRAIAGAFTEPANVQRLAEANVRNLAFATAVNGQKAWRAVRPIVETLRQFAADPNVPTGKMIDAVLEARKAADSMVKSTGIKDTPAEGMADTMLDVETAKAASSAVVKQARAAQGQKRSVVDASGKPLTEGATKARKTAATEAAAEANAPGKPPKKPKGGSTTESAKKAEKKTLENSNTARAAEHTAAAADVQKLIDDVISIGKPTIDDPVWDVDAAYAAFTMGLPGWLRTAFKGAEKMDGWLGKSDVKPFAISAEMNSQNMQHRYTTAVRAVEQKHDAAAIRGAISIFKGMDGNVGLDAALLGAPDNVAAAARDLWPTFSVVFDHSEHTLLQRIGMEGAYLNDYLRRQQVPEQFHMAGTQSWENGTAWTQWNWDAADAPLKLLDDYHRAIVKAQVVPDVAANFSSQFGNKSTVHGRPMSNEEARAAGWVKADTQSGRFGGLFHFIDKDQYYPKEMLTQLSLMDNYFNSSRSLDENTLFDKTFRYADPVVNSLKASITLWRPGHHVTNMMGEYLMNTLAGVVNPLRYNDARRIMLAAGKDGGQGMDDLGKYLRAAAPEGVQLKDSANGIPVMIRGQEVTLSDEQVYQLLDQSGAIIHHNQAEDLLNETFDTVGRTTKDSMSAKGPTGVQAALQKMNRTVAPGWLGRFSANRDNVFRIAHAADLLRKGSFNSVEDAMTRITKEINSFHPNMHTLGAMEQKYVRRFIYFYTWQRQAITRVAMSMIDTPGRITVAPKALYNVSAANGTEPDSWGDVVPDEPGIPDYLRGNIGQWMFNQGLVDDELGAQENYLWGQSLNAPQLDILQSVLGSVAVDPEKPLWEQSGDTAWQLVSKNVLQNLSPLFRIPAELGTHAQMGTGIPIQEGEEGEYLLNQTGIRGPLLFSGITPADKGDDERVTQMKRENALYNWTTGMRRTLYNGPEQNAIWMRQQQEKAREDME